MPVWVATLFVPTAPVVCARHKTSTVNVGRTVSLTLHITMYGLYICSFIHMFMHERLYPLNEAFKFKWTEHLQSEQLPSRVLNIVCHWNPYIFFYSIQSKTLCAPLHKTMAAANCARALLKWQERHALAPLRPCSTLFVFLYKPNDGSCLNTLQSSKVINSWKAFDKWTTTTIRLASTSKSFKWRNGSSNIT